MDRFLLLPKEIVVLILHYFTHPKFLEDFLAISITCKRLKAISNDALLWKEIYQVVARMLEIKFEPVFVKPLVLSWYNRNKPLCTCCGIPAKVYFKSDPMVSFVIPPGCKFVCPPCAQKLPRVDEVETPEVKTIVPEQKVNSTTKSNNFQPIPKPTQTHLPTEKKTVEKPRTKKPSQGYKKQDPDYTLLRTFKLIETNLAHKN